MQIADEFPKLDPFEILNIFGNSYCHYLSGQAMALLSSPPEFRGTLALDMFVCAPFL